MDEAYDAIDRLEDSLAREIELTIAPYQMTLEDYA